MYRLRFAVAAVIVTLGLAGCTDEGSGPVTPSELVVRSGDDQSAARATPLPQPIVVGVVDRSGNGASNITVTFTVREGSVDPSSAVTDARGQAQTVWTLGATIGTQTATATAAGLAAVTLQGIALDPCDVAAALAYTVGTTVGGNLVPTDCIFPDGSFVDVYALSTASFQSLRFDLRSNSIDAYLVLNDGLTNIVDGLTNIVALNDDADSSLNAAIRILARPDNYFVGANSFYGGETGPYTLSSAAVPAEVAGCQRVWVTRGIQTTQQVLATDCVDPSGPFYSDRFLLVLYPGQTVTIGQSSTAFDAALTLWDISSSPDAVVARDDNSGGGTNALLSYTAAGSNPKVYRIVAGTSAAGATGPYTLSIAPPTASAPVSSAPPQAVRVPRNVRGQTPPLKPAIKG